MHYNFQFKSINGGGLAQLQQLADTILAKVAYTVLVVAGSCPAHDKYL